MASFWIYSDVSDGVVKSTNATYSTARAGSNLTVTDNEASTTFAVGQVLDTGVYDIRQAFFQWDTSFLAVDETVLTAEVRFYHTSNQSGTHTLEVRAHDWGTALAITDFVAGADLGTKTLLATYTRPSAEGSGNRSYFSESGFPAAINKEGHTRVILTAQAQRLGEEPF